jgi:hypothetical protein
MKDGEKVYQYVKSNLISGKIGVHGESLGGCVSSYIGKKCSVDFVFTNRSFSSLIKVANWSYGGNLTSYALRFLTGWSEDCALNFQIIDKKCYKILGCDSDDRVITNMASVKTTLASSLVMNKLCSDS